MYPPPPPPATRASSLIGCVVLCNNNNITMAVAAKFKYLGVDLHGDKDITAAVAHRHSRMVAAQAAANRRLKELRIPYDPMVVTGPRRSKPGVRLGQQ